MRLRLSGHSIHTGAWRRAAGLQPVQLRCSSMANSVAASRRGLASSTAEDDEDDLRHAAIAGSGLGSRNPGLRGRTPGMGGRFTGATDGPAARRRERPAGRTGLDFRISDGSILNAESATSDLVVGRRGGGGDDSSSPISVAQCQLPATAAVARVSTARCKAGRLDDVVRYYDLRIGPAYSACDGFHNACLLVDRSTSTVRSLSFWLNSDSLLASIENEHYQKVAKGLLQLVDPNSMSAQTFEVGAQVQGEVEINKFNNSDGGPGC